jgi:hypothetical protein
MLKHTVCVFPPIIMYHHYQHTRFFSVRMKPIKQLQGSRYHRPLLPDHAHPRINKHTHNPNSGQEAAIPHLREELAGAQLEQGGDLCSVQLCGLARDLHCASMSSRFEKDNVQVMHRTCTTGAWKTIVYTTQITCHHEP